MNATDTNGANVAEEIYSLLVPLDGARLLVPRVCIAEVTGFAAPEPVPGSLPWLLGFFDWNGRRIPLVSFEGVCGRGIPAVGGRTRVVVFYALGGHLEAGYYGLVTQGFPQLVRVNAAVLGAENVQDWADADAVLCQVRMVNQQPLIPDLELLERMTADAILVAS